MALGTGDILTYNGSAWVNQPWVPGNFGIETQSPDTLLHITASDNTNAAVYGIKLQRTTSLTAAAGLGTGIRFVGQSGSTPQDIGYIQCIINNTGVGTFGSFVSFGVVSLGVTQEILRLRSFGTDTVGQIALNAPLAGLNAAPRLQRSAISMTSDADLTLSATQYQGFILEVTSTVSLTATRKIILPLSDGGTWHVFNNTSGAQQLNFIGASGTGVAVGNLKRAIIYTDGTNVVRLTPDT